MKILPDGSVQFINGQIESLESQARFKHICNQCKTIFDNERHTRPRIISNGRKYNIVRRVGYRVDLISQWCPHCETTVEIKNKFRAQLCPTCHSTIMPCCICEHKVNNNYNNCTNCPLDPQNKTKIKLKTL